MTKLPYLELRNLSKHFGGLRAITGLSAIFSPGQVASIIGPNGAGKTTVFNLIGGFLRADAGQINYKGVLLDRKPAHAIARLGLGRLFQEPRVFSRMTVLENVAASNGHGIGETLVGGILWPLLGRAHESENSLRSAEWLDFVGLGSVAHHRASSLSYGQQKKLAIARLLNGGATCLLLDEPTAGVQRDAVNTVLDLVRRIADMGNTVVMIEHNLDAVKRISNIVYVMNKGCVVAKGPPAEVITRESDASPLLGTNAAAAQRAAGGRGCI